MNQNEAILRHLRSGRTLTPLNALRLWGVFRLAARIHNLRKVWNIRSEKVKLPSGKWVCRYWLNRDPIA